MKKYNLLTIIIGLLFISFGLKAQTIKDSIHTTSRAKYRSASYDPDDRTYKDSVNYFKVRKMYKEAVAAEKARVKKDPTINNYIKLIFTMTYESKDYSEPEIMEVTDELINRYPDSSKVYSIRGHIYYFLAIKSKKSYRVNHPEPENETLDYLKKAIADYDKAILLEPNNADYYTARALTKQTTYLYSKDDILKDFSTSIKVSIKKSSYYLSRAIYYQQINKVKEAIADCDTAIGLDNTLLEVYLKRATLKDKLGNYPASEILEDLDKLKPLVDSYNAHFIWRQDYDRLMEKYAIKKDSIH